MDLKISPLITPEQVREVMNRPEVVLVDARGGPDAFERYKTSHLEGAKYVDLENDLSRKKKDPANGGRHPLPDREDFGSTLSALGISRESHVIVYDDKAAANAAARFWWMMKAAGHMNVQVIDGGFSAILKAGLPVSSRASNPTPSAHPYPVKDWNRFVTSVNGVAKALKEDEFLVLDVREAYRYEGISEPIDLVAGHIPGAVNLPYLNNLEEDGRFRSPQALAQQYLALLGDRDRRKLIVHCGSGVTACHTLLAMEHAGLPGASLYVGSWSEWSRARKEIATGKSA